MSEHTHEVIGSSIGIVVFAVSACPHISRPHPLVSYLVYQIYVCEVLLARLTSFRVNTTARCRHIAKSDACVGTDLEQANEHLQREMTGHPGTVPEALAIGEAIPQPRNSAQEKPSDATASSASEPGER